MQWNVLFLMLFSLTYNDCLNDCMCSKIKCSTLDLCSCCCEIKTQKYLQELKTRDPVYYKELQLHFRNKRFFVRKKD